MPDQAEILGELAIPVPEFARFNASSNTNTSNPRPDGD
jgi:hypothetical protein